MSTLKTHNLQSPDAGSVNIVMAPNAGMVVAGLSTYSNQINVGSNIKLGTAGVVTATSFSGSGANLTSLPVPTTITVADESSDTTCNPLFVTTTTGNLAPKTGTNLVFNSASGNLRTGSLFLGTSSNESKTQDGLILERNSSDGEVHITAGRSGGNYNGLQFYVAGGSGVTKRHRIDYQSNFMWYGADGTTERVRIDSSGRVVIGGTSAYIGGAALAVLGTSTTPNTYGSFAIGKVGANPTAGTTLANIRLNGGSIGTRRGAEINATTNGNWTDGSSHPTNLTFAVANVNSTSATQRVLINSHGHFQVTNENVFPASGSAGTNGFKGLTQLGYQHWGWRQYYSGQQNLSQNGYFNLFSNNVAHDDIIFWLNIKGYHGNRTFATAHGTIGGYGMSVSYQSASGVYGSFSGVNIGTGREQLRWTSTSPYAANWWIWGWYSGTSSTGTHTGHSAAQLH